MGTHQYSFVEVGQVEAFDEADRCADLPEVSIVNRHSPQLGSDRHQDRFRRSSEKFLGRKPEEEVVPGQEVDGEVGLAEDDVDLKR